MTSRLSEHIGRVLGDRYRLVAPIGAGASAMVFLADDISLKREVAVKLLHEGLANDQRFLQRFRSEAHTTASLNHQHLVAVYDSGFQDVPYLVTEYLAGGSLQSMLDAGHRLTISQALLVGLEASRALEYAHKRGLIHRDIKPSNLLFDEEGRLRVADFGLARALAEASVTEPMGAVVGSARYASPEQARGEQVDDKSDVYSLALSLIEAVTGDVPFATDTMVGTLMARVDTPIDVPKEMGPLHDALSQAGAVEPALRPDAGRFGTIMLEAAEILPRPEPLPLVGALNATVGYDPSPTDMGPVAQALPVGSNGTEEASPEVDDDTAATPVSPDDSTPTPTPTPTPPASPTSDVSSAEVTPADEAVEPTVMPNGVTPQVAGGLDPLVTVADLEPKQGVSDDLMPREPLFFDPVDTTLEHTAVSVPSVGGDVPTTVLPVAVGAGGEAPPDEVSPVPMSRRQERQAKRTAKKARFEDEPDQRDEKSSPLWIVTGFLLAIAMGVGVYYLWQNTEVVEHDVPNALGLTVDGLGPIIGEYGWEVTQLEGRKDGSRVGEIIKQSPEEGSTMPPGGEFRVTVSIGNEMVLIPVNIVGSDQENARLRLSAVGLQLGQVSFVPDENVPAGNVIRIGEAAFELPSGETVDLVLSEGPVPRTIPADLIGLELADVETVLRDLRLEPVVELEFSYDFDENVVMEIDPAAGELVDVGATISLLVSQGPEPIEIPDVVGDTLEDAEDTLRAARLCIGQIDGRNEPDAEVLATEPRAGQINTDPEDCVRIVTLIAETDESG